MHNNDTAGLLASITIDKDTPIPLYYQIKKQLQALIQDQKLKDGEMIPPESELCELLSVSRPTIRQAFGELVQEGHLRRYKGKGTFVASPKVEDRFFSKLECFNEEMLQKGMTPFTRLLELKKVAGRPEINEKLSLPIQEPLIFLSRLRFADEVPLVYVDTYLPFNRFSALMNVNFEKQSLYYLLENMFGIRVDRAVREIEATNARKREAALLETEPNSAICLVKTVAFSKDSQQPVEFSIARYRGDRNKFSVEIYR